MHFFVVFYVLPPMLKHIYNANTKNMQKEIIYRYLKGECTRDEELAIKEWYDQNPDKHQKEIDDVRFLFEGILIHHAIGKPATRTTLKSTSRRPIVHRFMQIAALIALMVGNIYGTYEYMFREISSRMTAIEAPAGQRVTLELSDGTHVWLNSGSKIEYPIVFSRKSRLVKMSGEVMFDVKPDADHPFIVETFASRIEVLGTKFNVEADEANDYFSTSLIHGNVKVSTEMQEVYLHPDQTVNLINGNLIVSHTEDPDSMLWTDGILSMKGVSFEELMDKFEKLYNVRIVYDCKAMPVIEFSSGKIRIADGIDHALNVLQHFTKFDYERDEQSNIIHIK